MKYTEKNMEKTHIHYGAEPNGPMSSPWGKFEEYTFDNVDDAKKFMEKKIDEKLKKKYEAETKSAQSQIFK
jgi:hypothetical protein